VRLLLGLALALAASACGAPGATGDAPSFPPDTVGVAIDQLAYSPASLTVPAGTTIAWINRETAAHDVAADDGSFTSPTLQRGDTWTRTFDLPGTWTYHCTIHPEMTGTITVR
jgi:plastocyanin